MDLFIIEGFKAAPKPEILLIHPFKDIWENDPTEMKDSAIKDFTYINFMCSTFTTNPFRDAKEDERSDKIIHACFKGEYEPSDLVIEAIDVIKYEFLHEMSKSYKLLLAAKESIKKVTDFLNTVNLNERNEKTNVPIFKATDIVKVQSSLSASVIDLKKLEKAVEEEYKETGRTVSNKTINPLERKPKNLIK